MRNILLPLTALALVSGCTTTGASSPPLTDSEWRFIAIDGAPPVGEATLAFQGDRLAAYAGCNRMGSTWRSEGGKLVAGPVVATQMFCEGRMEQERAVANLIDGHPELTLDGRRMTLRTMAHSAQLERKR